MSELNKTTKITLRNLAMSDQQNGATEGSESRTSALLCDLREKVAKIIWLGLKDTECSNQVAYEKADEIIKLCDEKHLKILWESKDELVIANKNVSLSMQRGYKDGVIEYYEHVEKKISST